MSRALTEEQLLARSDWPKGTRFTLIKPPMWEVYCPICSVDRYVKAGLCSGRFRNDHRNISAGQRACRCGVGYRWTEEQYIYRINTDTDYKFLRWEGEFKGNSSKVTLYCPHHNGEMTIVLRAVLNGSGCFSCFGKRKRPQEETEKLLRAACKEQGYTFIDIPVYRSNKSEFTFHCSEHGTQKMLISNMLSHKQGCPECKGKNQSYCYIHVVQDGDLPIALKFGITKNPKLRLTQQRRKTSLILVQACVFKFPSVALCKNAEREIKNTLPCGLLTKKEIPDGWTETISLTSLEDIIEIFEKLGGICVRD